MPTLAPLKKRNRHAGFTLIELVVALAVVGLLMGVVISQADRFLEWDMKKASNQLSSTIRYLYNKSAMEGLYIRLTFDIDERSYWVEATSDPMTLSRESEADKTLSSAKKGQGKEKNKKEEAGKAPEKQKGVEAAGGEEKPGKIAAPEPKFTPVDAYLLKPTKLPDTVFIKDIQVEHRISPIEAGKESIYFFPNGYVEHSILNFRDEKDETHYSLETNPISGRVKIEDRYRKFGESE